MVFVCFSPSSKSGLLDVDVFCKLNSKSDIDLPRSSLKYILDFKFLDKTLWSNWFCSFVQATAITLSLVLCLARYSLLANILHPSKRCYIVPLCSLHSLHWLILVSLWVQSLVLILTKWMMFFLILDSASAIYVNLRSVLLLLLVLLFTYFTMHFPFAVLFQSFFFITLFEAFFF